MQCSGFENPNYKQTSYDIRNKQVKTKTMLVHTKIILGAVGFITLLSLLVYFFISEGQGQGQVKSRSEGFVASNESFIYTQKTSQMEELLYPNSSENQLDRIKKQYNATVKEGSRVTILFWSVIGYNFDKEILKTLKGVDNRTCLITTVKAELNISDVVVFPVHAVEHFPEKRASDKQIWVYQSLKPVTKTISEEIRFNWTATFNLNSTVPFPAMMFFKRDTKRSINITANKIKNDVLVAVYFDSTKEHNQFKSKLDQLKDIKVDTYIEDCNNTKCSKPYSNLKCCLDNIKDKYKFYLVFGDTFCDYVSIHFFRALKQGLIPIVWGGPPKSLYELMVPQSKPSFIYMDDYIGNTKELKTLLDFLNKNDDDYNAYFEWKSDYYYNTNYGWYKQLCNMANLYKGVKMEVRSNKDWNGLPCEKGNSSRLPGSN